MPAASEPPAGPPAPGAGSGTGAPPLPVRFRPYGVRVAAVVFSVLLLGTLTAVFVALPDEIQRGFSFLQWLTVGGMVLGALVIANALARCRVDCDEEGVTVVNGYRTYRFVWGQVVAVTLRPGDPWTGLDLSDGTTRAAMGIQGSDGQRARRQARQLRALTEARAAEEPRSGPV